ncbi:MAG TPA: class I SAM-dependent methyltransferase [Tepidisphaeraceae bacterium]|nr:class I SAM-dependent methyltransferase [Tepidisphaeraceae bacterium]
MASDGDGLKAVADKWSAFEPDLERTFFGFPPLNPYRIRTAYGDGPHVERYKHNRYWPEDSVIESDLAGRNVETVFSLCCGFGHVERHFVKQLKTVKRCLAVDLAPGAIEAAKQRAAGEGLGDVIDYRVADLNRYDWAAEAGKYDLVIANGALHHLSDLETIIPALKNLLRDGGTLYAGEHVGASHQDYPPRQLELINAMAWLVPPDMRARQPRRPAVGLRPLDRVLDVMRGDRHIEDPDTKAAWSPRKRLAARALRRLFPGTRTGKIRFGLLHDSQRDHLLRTDPSEGVRSADVIPLLRRHFSTVDVRPYGGGLIAYAIDRRFYEKYDAANPAHVRLLDLITSLEAHFTATGECPMEHAIIVARP